MQTKRQHRKSRSLLFSPDALVDSLSVGLRRDLAALTQEYRGNEAWKLEFADRQLTELRKKYEPEHVDTKTLETLTLQKFHKVNTHMGSVEFQEPTYLRVESKVPFRDKVLLRAKSLMAFVLGSFSYEELFLECKNSAGATLKCPYTDTSVEKKFTFPLTATSSAQTLMDEYIAWDSDLRIALQDLNAGSEFASMYETVLGSRATTVPKNDQILRLIAIEPTVNMFFQQGAMAMMYKRMEAVGLSLESLPTEHVRRAFTASITGREATIDFTSASDCVLIRLVRWLLPPDWFEVLMMLRSPQMMVDDQWVNLNMISTMGNATTFPLETLVFWTLAHAVRLSLEPGNTLFPEWEDLKVVSVFGDDCIVPSYMAADFIEICSQVGFLVNEEKSFFDPEPGFRESCGGDFRRGKPTRPVHIRAPAGRKRSFLEPWLYTIVNRLIPKYMVCFGSTNYVYKSGLFGWFVDCCREYDIRIKLVPHYFPDDAGLKMSHDIERFVACYSPPLDRLARDSDTGAIVFRFCRFVYHDKAVSRDDGLRYQLLLKQKEASLTLHSVKHNPVIGGTDRWPQAYRYRIAIPERKPALDYRTRRRGGYVVARGLSSCWSLAAKKQQPRLR